MVEGTGNETGYRSELLALRRASHQRIVWATVLMSLLRIETCLERKLTR